MGKPQIGLSTLFCLSETFGKMTENIVKAKTACIEIIDEGLHELNGRRVQVLNELAASHGLKYTVHAPFADINTASPSKPLLNAMLKRLKKSIACTSALNSPLWVFHPGLKTGVSMFYPRKDWIQNLESARLLFKVASDYGVKAAIENVPEPYPFVMKSVEDFKRFYSEVYEDIGLVLDIGHANLNGQIERFLTAFGNKTVHIHAHDNNGKSDQHLGIGHGTVDWERVAALVKGISYEGVVIVECVEHIEEGLQRLRQLFKVTA